MRRQADGDALDLDRAIEAQIDRRARRTPDQRVYARTGRRREELCLLVLLDLSRSTGDAVPGTGRSRLELARDGCLRLADALAAQRTRFAIHGFSSNGRHEVEYHLLKALDGAWDAAARSAVARDRTAALDAHGRRAAPCRAATSIAPGSEDACSCS